MIFALKSYLPWTDEHKCYRLTADFIREADEFVSDYLDMQPCPARIPRNRAFLRQYFDSYLHLLEGVKAAASGRPEHASEFIGPDLDVGSKLLAPDLETWRAR